MTAAQASPVNVDRQDADAPAVLSVPNSENVARLRTELLTVFLEQMNLAQVPYCLLSGYQGYPEAISSDVDFMVDPSDLGRVAPLVLQAARRCDALLVQAIRHETGAWYFAVAKQAGCEVAYLHPDCSGDYRRDGRLWLEAQPVLAKRRPWKAFFVPAIADEFLYYLIKKTLKQGITTSQWQRTVAMYLSSPQECDKRMRRYWSDKTVEGLEAALVRQDTGWTRSHLPALLSELRRSAPVEGWKGGMQQRLQEWRRWLERVAHPTGFSIAVCGGTRQQRTELVEALETNLKPAFRRTMVCGAETAGEDLWNTARVWLAKVRSTLVIRTPALAEAGWLAQDEIVVVLVNEKYQEASDQRTVGAGRVWCALREGQPLQTNVQQATRFILEYLAQRLQRRMKLDQPASEQKLHVDTTQELACGTRSVP